MLSHNKIVHLSDIVPLTSWCIVLPGMLPFLSPEEKKLAVPRLYGVVFTKDIRTSPIVNIIGRLVQTKSGTYYRLSGEPCQEFQDLLSQKKIPYLPYHPFAPCYSFFPAGELRGKLETSFMRMT